VFLRTVLSIQRKTLIVTIVLGAVILTRLECNVLKTWVLQGRNFATYINFSIFTALFGSKSSVTVLYRTCALCRLFGLSETEDKCEVISVEINDKIVY